MFALSIPKSVMPSPVRRLYRRLRPISHPPKPEKLRLIDLALSRGATRFADLGGMWGVDGAYAIHAADHGAASVVLVDGYQTPAFISARARRPNLAFLNANFALPSTAVSLAPLDTVMLYDVLLHQVAPNWDEVLATYATHLRWILVYNQQFTGGNRTVRLIDRGEAWYRRHAPIDDSNEGYRNLFEHPNEVNVRWPTGDGRLNRDVTDVWQWGITDDDLIRVMDECGFSAAYSHDCGRMTDIEDFKEHAWLFEKR